MLDLERAKELCEKATPGPWDAILWPNGEFEIQAEDGPTDTTWGNVCSTASSVKDGMEEWCYANASFIAFARTFIPAAIERIEKLEKVMKAARRYYDHGTETSYVRLGDALREAEEE